MKRGPLELQVREHRGIATRELTFPRRFQPGDIVCTRVVLLYGDALRLPAGAVGIVCQPVGNGPPDAGDLAIEVRFEVEGGAIRRFTAINSLDLVTPLAAIDASPLSVGELLYEADMADETCGIPTQADLDDVPPRELESLELACVTLNPHAVCRGEGAQRKEGTQ